MSRRRLISITTALASLISLGSFATVSHAQVPLATYGVAVINSPELPPHTFFDYSISTPGVLAGSACEPGIYGGCETSNGYALPGLAVSASGVTVGGFYTAVGASQSQITYYYEVLGPAYSVPMEISGVLTTSATGANAQSNAGISATYGPNLNACSTTMMGGCLFGYPANASLNDAAYTVPTGVIAAVSLIAYGYSDDGSGGYSALADPMVQIDPAFLLDNPGFSLVFSSNITSLSAVPEPAAWAMVMVGLGGLGAAMRSRRRQAAFTP